MKSTMKMCGILFLVCFSFYYTEKIAYIMQDKDNLMIQINNLKDNYDVNYVNAIINENTIIPGINGIAVNSKKSYSKMKSFNVFNETYLEYDQIKPSVSLENNKDKIIIKGNKNKKAIAFIVENDFIKSYLLNSGYKIDYQNICVIKSVESLCEDYLYKVKPSIIINHQNALINKNYIESGDIILINKNVTLSEIKSILEEIKYRDLNIISLNELISEEKNIN